MAIIYYFANDGAYGEGANGVVVDTAKWTDRDWDAVSDCADDVRAHLARILTEYRGGRIIDMVPIDQEALV